MPRWQWGVAFALWAGCGQASPELDTTRLPLDALTPDDPYFGDQWTLHNEGPFTTADGRGDILGADHAHVAEAWQLLVRLGLADGVGDMGRDVRLAVLDDGFDLAHPDLADSVVASINLGGAVEPDNLFSDTSPADSHGTLVAGIALARGDNGEGIAGACPACGLVGVRITAVPEALCLERHEHYRRMFEAAMEADPDIIHASWGPEKDLDPELLRAALDVTDQGRGGLGTILVFASGNDGEDFAWNALAGDPRTLAVGASDSLGRWHAFSNYGQALDLLAPTSGAEKSGGGFGPSVYIDRIWTTDNYLAPGCLAPGATPSSSCSDQAGLTPNGPVAGGDGWVGQYSYRFSHTSSAAPLVSGVVGLMLHANPDLTRAEVQRLLRESADPIDTEAAGYDANGHSTTHGYGRVNALRAVQAAVELAQGPLDDAVMEEIEEVSPSCPSGDCESGDAAEPAGDAVEPGASGASEDGDVPAVGGPPAGGQPTTVSGDGAATGCSLEPGGQSRWTPLGWMFALLWWWWRRRVTS